MIVGCRREPPTHRKRKESKAVVGAYSKCAFCTDLGVTESLCMLKGANRSFCWAALNRINS